MTLAPSFHGVLGCSAVGWPPRGAWPLPGAGTEGPRVAGTVLQSTWVPTAITLRVQRLPHTAPSAVATHARIHTAA